LFSFFLSWLSWYCFHIVQLIRFIRTCPYPAYHIALHVRDIICAIYTRQVADFANVKNSRIWCLDTRTHVCYLALFYFSSSLLLLLHFCFCFSRTNMLKVFFVYSYLMFLICFLFLPILHRYCLVLFVFFLLLLLLLCVFIYTVVPSSESFITKGFLMFLIAYLLPCRFDRLITLTIN